MNKRKRNDGHEFRTRLSPFEQLKVRSRRQLAEIGEPSRREIDLILRQVSEDISELLEEGYGAVLEMIRAVVYEQPHKIGYVALVVELVNKNKPAFSAQVVEMIHDHLTGSLRDGDYDKFKLYLRFVCALSPIIEVSGLEPVLKTVVERAIAEKSALGDYLWASVVYATLYLEPKPSKELVDLLTSYEPVDELSEDSRVFWGDSVPYELEPTSKLLSRAVRKLRESNWDRTFMHDRESLLRPKSAQVDLPAVPPKPASEPNGEDKTGETEVISTETGNGSAEATNSTDMNSTNTASNAEEHSATDAESTAKPTDAPVQAPSTEIQNEAESQPKETDSQTQATEPQTQTAEPQNQEETQEASQAEPQTQEVSNKSPPEQVNESAESTDSTAQEPQETRHRFPTLFIPEELATPQRTLHPGEPFLRIYVNTERETVPPPDHIFGLLLRDVALDNIRHMEFNRREVTRQLITLDLFFNSAVFAPPGVPLDALLEYPPDRSTWKVEDIALEAVLSQTLALPLSEFPMVYYDTILIEACIMAPQAIAPVLGRTLRFLFAHCETLDAEGLFRVVDWFAHHVSNFAFTWKWNEWLYALELPEMHPKQVFMRELLAKQVRLSYPQRVRDLLPDEFVPLVPDIPDPPPFPYTEDHEVVQLKNALESGNTDKQADTESAANALVDKLSPEWGPIKTAKVLATCVCALGNRSLLHVSNWIEKTRDLLVNYVNGPDQQTAVVEAVLEYRQQAAWIGGLVLEEFVRAGVIGTSVLIEYVASKPELLVTSAGWEILGRHPTEAAAVAESVTVDDSEWGQWWTQRLRKALKRRAETQIAHIRPSSPVF